jgi:iron(III) transport system ATP-binding protein
MEPSVLLLDEPLSNLDAQLREEMRAEIKDLQERLGITVVYVTHDQAEAMALSGRIAVLRAGRVAQHGTPAEVYEQPADPFVAASLGVANFLPAAVVKPEGGETRVRLLDGSGAEIAATGRIAEAQALVCIRPEDLEFDVRGPLRGTVQSCTYLGSHMDYLVRIGELTLRVQTRGGLSVRPGVAVGLRVRRAIAYPHSTCAVASSGNPTT